MRVFFPIEDAVVDDATGVLVPYRCGLACANELRGELVLRDGVWSERPAFSAGSSARHPETRPACAPGPR
ncbi:hypothetical protein EV148_101364 [Dokdonella fugitiva]|jgi:hypothetical protein|uniref:Uncharacterized protein n=1 Tax=Dokdonella fugitiva TaxID=328517 RepID=A0A4R2IF35_9GAMM|nr:hypothetical protein [Dokdonella fugitiva]TCO42957.1 hypothetical protein EV148_101364 [Dokdonella fugitiva]